MLKHLVLAVMSIGSAACQQPLPGDQDSASTERALPAEPESQVLEAVYFSNFERSNLYECRETCEDLHSEPLATLVCPTDRSVCEQLDAYVIKEAGSIDCFVNLKVVLKGALTAELPPPRPLGWAKRDFVPEELLSVETIDIQPCNNN